VFFHFVLFGEFYFERPCKNTSASEKGKIILYRIKRVIDTHFQEPLINYNRFQKAQLVAKIKKYFPRLPICILEDGLYPNNTVFDICVKNDWKFIITLKDGNLKTIQAEVDL